MKIGLAMRIEPALLRLHSTRHKLGQVKRGDGGASLIFDEKKIFCFKLFLDNYLFN